jgi:hypothetical protein
LKIPSSATRGLAWVSSATRKVVGDLMFTNRGKTLSPEYLARNHGVGSHKLVTDLARTRGYSLPMQINSLMVWAIGLAVRE